MMNRFLNNVAPIIGKYFRPVGLLVIGLISFSFAYFTFSELIIREFGYGLYRTIWSIWFVLPSLFFLIVGVVTLWLIFKKSDEKEHKEWGVAFYFLVLGLLIYILWCFLSEWIDFNVFDYII